MAGAAGAQSQALRAESLHLQRQAAEPVAAESRPLLQMCPDHPAQVRAAAVHRNLRRVHAEAVRDHRLRQSRARVRGLDPLLAPGRPDLRPAMAIHRGPVLPVSLGPALPVQMRMRLW